MELSSGLITSVVMTLFLIISFLNGCIFHLLFTGNPWPPVVPNVRSNRGNLVNVLLEAARNDTHFMSSERLNVRSLPQELDELNLNELNSPTDKVSENTEDNLKDETVNRTELHGDKSDK